MNFLYAILPVSMLLRSVIYVFGLSSRPWGLAPICPKLYLPLILNDNVPEEHKDGIDMGQDMLKRSRMLLVCGGTVDEDVKNDIAVAARYGIAATTLEGIMNVKGHGSPDSAGY